MSDEAELATALDGLSEALLGSEEARSVAAAVADEELAAQWEGLRKATSDYEKRLREWSDRRRESARERQRLLDDARTLSSAWSAAREHLGRGANVAGKLRDGVSRLDALADDDRASLAAALKNALRSFSRAALDPVPPRAQPARPSPELAVLRAKLEEQVRATLAAEDEARKLKVELEAARLRLARAPERPMEGSDSAFAREQAREFVAMRSDREALLKQLAQARQEALQLDASPSRASHDLEKMRAELAQRDVALEQARAALEKAKSDAKALKQAPPPAAHAALAPPPPASADGAEELERELRRARAKLAKLTSELEKS